MGLRSLPGKIRTLYHSEPVWLSLVGFYALAPTLISASLFLLFHPYLNRMTQSFPSTLIFYVATIPGMAFGLTPTTVIAIVSGYYFGWPGLLLLAAAYPLAALTGVVTSSAFQTQTTGRTTFSHPGLASLAKAIGHRQFLFFFFCRLSPFLPFAMTNAAISGMKVQWLPFLSGSLTGMFPRTLLFFLAGSQTRDILAFLENPSTEGLQQLAMPVFLLISVAGLYLVLKKALQEIQNQPEKPETLEEKPE